MTLAFIPSPSANGFHLGPLFIHVYGLMYVLAVVAAIVVTRWLWVKAGGHADLIYELAAWGFPAGLIGGRIYFLITTPSQIPPHWWGPFAIWKGGLGIWGGIAAGVAVGLWRVQRKHMPRAHIRVLMDCVAPALLVSQSIGRIGNYFNQELFGAPSKLPWALEISPAHRPPGYLQYATFEPTFLYELVWNLLLAGFLAWLVRRHRESVRPPGIFALYVAGYSAMRIFEETQRIDYSNYFLGLRVNFFIACILCAIGLLWFVGVQLGWHPWYRLLGKEPPPTEPIAAATTVAAAQRPPATPRPQPAAGRRARRSRIPG
ncbi:MAG: prolipoprotein diacylglyceryl transferase [Solirubrobacterales bacterium]|nr:prolipoprotein diacylglyceryl transferase [Solirubrobacterales bacterium]